MTSKTANQEDYNKSNALERPVTTLLEWIFILPETIKTFFTSTDHRGYNLWPCQNVCNALSYLLDNIYIRFGNKLYRQIVGIPIGTICALFCNERDSMISLSVDNQADIIEASNPTS